MGDLNPTVELFFFGGRLKTEVIGWLVIYRKVRHLIDGLNEENTVLILKLFNDGTNVHRGKSTKC